MVFIDAYLETAYQLKKKGSHSPIGEIEKMFVKKATTGQQPYDGITVNIDAGEFAANRGYLRFIKINIRALYREVKIDKACMLRVITSLRLKRKIFRFARNVR